MYKIKIRDISPTELIAPIPCPMTEVIHGMNDVTLAKPAGPATQPRLETNDVTPINIHFPSAPWIAKGPPLSPFQIKSVSFSKCGSPKLFLISHWAGRLVGCLCADGRIDDSCGAIVLGAGGV